MFVTIGARPVLSFLRKVGAEREADRFPLKISDFRNFIDKAGYYVDEGKGASCILPGIAILTLIYFGLDVELAENDDEDQTGAYINKIINEFLEERKTVPDQPEELEQDNIDEDYTIEEVLIENSKKYIHSNIMY